MIKPMLAEKYKPELVRQGQWIAEPKIDGVRAIWDGQTLWGRGSDTRPPRPITNPPSVLACLRENFKGLMLDGELAGTTWGETVSVTRTEQETDSTSVVYWVWDYLGSCRFPAFAHTQEQRKCDMLDLWDGCGVMIPVRFVHYEPVDINDVMKIAQQYQAEKYEGAMLKELSAPYLQGMRSKNWLKVKFSSTIDVMVIGAEVGKGMFSKTLGAVIVEDGGGNKFKVGTGFTSSERSELWTMHRAGILAGSMAEVSVQRDGSSITARFPVWGRLRVDLGVVE
jgi:DNA ligase-1